MNTIQTTGHTERDAHAWSGWPGLGTPLARKDISSWLIINPAAHNYCFVVFPTSLGCHSPENRGYILARGHAHHSLEMGWIDADSWAGHYSSSRSGMSKETEMGNPRWQEGNRKQVSLAGARWRWGLSNIGPGSEKPSQCHPNKFRGYFVYRGEPLKVYGEHWCQVIYIDLCREEELVTRRSVRRPLQCSREM